MRQLASISKAFLIGITIIFLNGCEESAEQKAALRELSSKYQDQYSFKLEEGVYLLVRPKHGKAPEFDKAVEIYKKAEEAGVEHVYLNVHDSKGKFHYQIFWDPKEQTFIRSQADYY